jgi:hypothetical protein
MKLAKVDPINATVGMHTTRCAADRIIRELPLLETARPVCGWRIDYDWLASSARPRQGGSVSAGAIEACLQRFWPKYRGVELRVSTLLRSFVSPVLWAMSL